MASVHEGMQVEFQAPDLDAWVVPVLERERKGKSMIRRGLHIYRHDLVLIVDQKPRALSMFLSEFGAWVRDAV